MIVRIILLAGFCYVMVLLSFIENEVPYSEDSGIKTIMVKQYNDGNFKSTLSLEAPVWVHDLWDQGLYPFRKPFVYDLPNGKTVVFPPLFQIISSPFYKAFGFRGLYIIPAISLFLLWIVFAKTCKALKLNDRVTQFALVAIIFSSSLTVYSAIFWEHTLTSLLSVCGLYYLISSIQKNENPPKIKSFLFGSLAGLALWLRPEALIILLAFLIWSVYYVRKTKLKSIRFFIVGILLSMAGYLLFNYFIFENPLGLRSKQIVDRFDLVQRLMDGGYIFIVLFTKTILFDPVSLLVLICIVLIGKSLLNELKEVTLIPVTHLLILSISVFYLTCPWILPNTGGRNWGIRYALVSIPLFYILAAVLVDKIYLDRKRYKVVIISALVIILAGSIQNTIGGSKMLLANYQGPKNEVVEYLQKENVPIILTTKSYHAAELECLMPQSTFILTDEDELLNKFLANPESAKTPFLLLYDKGDAYSELLLKESSLKGFVLKKTFGNFLIYNYQKE
ncbi:MAG: hypothetical protein ABI663_02540 [Chryseolinea sp.]